MNTFRAWSLISKKKLSNAIFWFFMDFLRSRDYAGPRISGYPMSEKCCSRPGLWSLGFNRGRRSRTTTLWRSKKEAFKVYALEPWLCRSAEGPWVFKQPPLCRRRPLIFQGCVSVEKHRQEVKLILWRARSASSNPKSCFGCSAFFEKCFKWFLEIKFNLYWSTHMVLDRDLPYSLENKSGLIFFFRLLDPKVLHKNADIWYKNWKISSKYEIQIIY